MSTRVLQTLKHMISCFEMQEKNSEALDTCLKAREVTDFRFGDKSSESIAITIRIVSNDNYFFEIFFYLFVFF